MKITIKIMKPIAIGPTMAIQPELLDGPRSSGKTIGVIVGSVSAKDGVLVSCCAVAIGALIWGVLVTC